MPWIRLILYYLFRALDLLLLVYCVFSWFIRDPYNKIYRVLSTLCDPILDPFRRLLEKIPFLANCPIDFSPIALMLVLQLIARLLLI